MFTDVVRARRSRGGEDGLSPASNAMSTSPAIPAEARQSAWRQRRRRARTGVGIGPGLRALPGLGALPTRCWLGLRLSLLRLLPWIFLGEFLREDDRLFRIGYRH